ncbi:MAG: GNAT family N-acetyltransferase [Pseudonocardiaceae bacterium]
MTDAQPMHTMAHRLHNEFALLPGYLYEAPPDIDFDPRTYLGWQPQANVQACCGGGQTDARASERIESLGAGAFFPALVLGSPLGYRSEVAFTFWTPELYRLLIRTAVQEARERGVRCIVAPWIPDRAGNQHLISALQEQGAVTGFYGTEDYLSLTTDSYEAHVAGMSTRRRRQWRLDRENAASAGVKFDRLDGAKLAAAIPRLAELSLMNRERYGASDQRAHFETLLNELLTAGADIRCWVARKDEELVGMTLGIRRLDRVFIKWIGFDYAALGERSGVYFVLLFDAPMADGYTEGVRFIECGMGSHEAKMLRGCESRRITSAFLMTDPTLISPVSEALASFSTQRESLFAMPSSRDTEHRATLNIVRTKPNKN